VSITKTRKFIERSGCGLIVSIVVGVIMLLGIVMYGQRGAPRMDEKSGPAVFQVGDLEVPAQAVELLAQAAAATQGARLEALPPLQKAQVYAAVLQELTLKAKLYQIAKRSGVKMDDEAIRKGIDGELNAMVANLHSMLLSLKRIPEKTTVEELAKNPAIQGQMQEVRAILERMMQNEALREVLAARYADQGLRDAERAKVAADDASIKTMFDTYVLNGILVSLSSSKPEEAKELGRKIADEIKAQGFEAVAKRYREQKNPAVEVFEGRRMPRTFLAMLEEYRPVLSLKKGETTGFVESPTGGAVFQVADVVNEPPSDFEKRKDQYKAQYIDQQAALSLQRQIAEVEKTTPVVWKDAGFKALYDWSQAPRTREALLKVAEEAKAASEAENTIGLPQAILARYAAVEDAWSLAPEKDRASLKEIRAEAIAGLLGIAEDATLRLELARLYLDLKKGDQAYEQLLNAAEVNTGFDPENLATHKATRELLDRLVAAKLVTDAQKQAVEKELARWEKEKAENDQILAEQKRMEEEMARKDREEAAKLEAEEKARLKAEQEKAKKQAPAEPTKK
jgi:hypothetical protein